MEQIQTILHIKIIHFFTCLNAYFFFCFMATLLLTENAVYYNSKNTA